MYKLLMMILLGVSSIGAAQSSELKYKCLTAVEGSVHGVHSLAQDLVTGKDPFMVWTSEDVSVYHSALLIDSTNSLKAQFVKRCHMKLPDLETVSDRPIDYQLSMIYSKKLQEYCSDITDIFAVRRAGMINFYENCRTYPDKTITLYKDFCDPTSSPFLQEIATFYDKNITKMVVDSSEQNLFKDGIRIWILFKPFSSLKSGVESFCKLLRVRAVVRPGDRTTIKERIVEYVPNPGTSWLNYFLKSYEQCGIEDIQFTPNSSLALVGGNVTYNPATTENTEFVVTGLAHFGSFTHPPEKLFVIRNSSLPLLKSVLYLLSSNQEEKLKFMHAMQCDNDQCLTPNPELSLHQLSNAVILEKAGYALRKKADSSYELYKINPNASVKSIQNLSRVGMAAVFKNTLIDHDKLYWSTDDGKIFSTVLKELEQEPRVPILTLPEWIRYKSSCS